MMTCKNIFFLLFFGLFPVAFATPSMPILCAIAYLIGYPILIIYAFSFKKKKSRGLFLYSCGVFYFLVQMNWLAITKYHGALIIFVYLFFSFVFACSFYFLGYFLPKKASMLNATAIGFIALGYVFLEYSRLWIFCGFPFHVTGLILTSNAIPLQLASVIGLYGLSFIVILQGLFSAKWFFCNSYFKYFSFSLLPLFLGSILYNVHDIFSKKKEKVDVAIVQTGLLVEEKWDLANYSSFFIPAKLQLKKIWETLEKLPPTDLVVLPEVCLPGDGTIKRYTFKDLKEIFPEEMRVFFSEHQKMSYLDVFSALSIFLNTDIMLGFIAESSNSSFYISKGEIQGRYNKRRLLPFGEYIPFNFLKKIASRYGVDAFFIHGMETNIINGKWRILPSICFDEGFPDDFIKYTKYKPQIHINLTNDAWFINSSLAKNHFDIGRVRSVENGFFSIRACNTGVSAVISPLGIVRKKLAEKDSTGEINQGVLLDSFFLYTEETIFSKIGNLGLLTLVGLILGALKFFTKKVVILKA